MKGTCGKSEEGMNLIFWAGDVEFVCSRYIHFKFTCDENAIAQFSVKCDSITCSNPSGFTLSSNSNINTNSTQTQFSPLHRILITHKYSIGVVQLCAFVWDCMHIVMLWLVYAYEKQIEYRKKWTKKRTFHKWKAELMNPNISINTSFSVRAVRCCCCFHIKIICRLFLVGVFSRFGLVRYNTIHEILKQKMMFS